MSFTFDYYSISLLIGGFTAFLSGLVVYIHNRKKLENIAWLLSNITSAIWSFGYFLTITATSKDFAIWSDWVLHVASIYIPACYFLSVISITDTYEKYKKQLVAFALIGCIFLVLAPTTLFVRDVIPKFQFNFVPDAGPLYIYYTIYFFVLVLCALYILFQQYQITTDKIQKNRYGYMILFTLLGFGGGGSVFFITFNIPILPYGLLLFSLYPAVSGYAIFRYQLFNVKVITAELVVFTLWISLLLRILLATQTVERLINGGLLLFTVVAGILLIRSVIKEVSLREKIENLAKDLEKANGALEGANNNLAKANSDLATVNDRLKELDQLKSEFLSLATHQIRAPLTAIKGYASLLLEGDYGELAPETRGAVNTIFQSCQNLVVIVGEFLDISRIEQGRMKYEMADFDVSKLCEEVLVELKPNIEKTGLTSSFTVDDKAGDKSWIVNADQGKIKQVIGNVIDNAIKYTPSGSIAITVSQKAKKVLIAVTDTGIGIDKDDIPKLFSKFTRAKDANKQNVIGTGLGLYVAKQMVEAQNGRVWVESKGKGLGSTFFIELSIGTIEK